MNCSPVLGYSQVIGSEVQKNPREERNGKEYTINVLGNKKSSSPDSMLLLRRVSSPVDKNYYDAVPKIWVQWSRSQSSSIGVNKAIFCFQHMSNN